MGDRHLSPPRGYAGVMHVFVSLVLTTLLLLPREGSSQSLRPREKQPAKAAEKNEKRDPVPKQYLPPPGMCRIWVDNVPAARQPAPTDCATAIRNKPPNARVLFPAGRSGQEKGIAPGRGRTDTTTKRKPPG